MLNRSVKKLFLAVFWHKALHCDICVTTFCAIAMKRPAQAPGSRSKSSKGSQAETASEAAETAKQCLSAKHSPEPEVKAAEVPQAAVPAPEKKAEDLASQLSKSDSLAAKLELLKADETMTSQQKLQLMQEQLSAKELECLQC